MKSSEKQKLAAKITKLLNKWRVVDFHMEEHRITIEFENGAEIDIETVPTGYDTWELEVEIVDNLGLPIQFWPEGYTTLLGKE